MSGNSILLADPFENILVIYRTILEEEGYQVETAPDLDVAAHCFSISHYPIIITEYFYSFEDTVDFIQWVKKIAPETYIILNTSAIIDDLTYGKLFNNGLDDYLLKPYAPEKLMVHVKKGFKQRGLIIENREKGSRLLDPIAEKSEEMIFNPPYFKKVVRQELKKAKRHQQPMSLLLIKMPKQEDMGNRFEPFYIDLVKILRNSLRDEDLLGRENGKLGILLSQTDQTGSRILGQRLSKAIQSHPSFESDDFLRPLIHDLSFQHYTFPSQAEVPAFVTPLLKEIDSQYPSQ